MTMLGEINEISVNGLGQNGKSSLNRVGDPNFQLLRSPLISQTDEAYNVVVNTKFAGVFPRDMFTEVYNMKNNKTK